ncbi:hypothetical protein CASFOL_006482 [Castilleja foliolosa]|uniref:Uncharacterized protein n=1 Tax=Castilleja foliolosa TaxID=1961234 RepID=A0ABD3EAE6_9LAMI
MVKRKSSEPEEDVNEELVMSSKKKQRLGSSSSSLGPDLGGGEDPDLPRHEREELPDLGGADVVEEGGATRHPLPARSSSFSP